MTIKLHDRAYNEVCNRAGSMAGSRPSTTYGGEDRGGLGSIWVDGECRVTRCVRGVTGGVRVRAIWVIQTGREFMLRREICLLRNKILK